MHMKWRRLFAHRSENTLLLGCIFFLVLAFAGDSTTSVTAPADVIDVSDGDTLRLYGQRYRLYGVDCPESGQDYGQEATRITKEALQGGHIEFKEHGRDKYGRTVATVVLGDGTTLQEHLLRSGGAWVYWEFCRTPLCLYWIWLEWEARRNKIGLWVQEQPIAPWEWRKINKGMTSYGLCKR